MIFILFPHEFRYGKIKQKQQQKYKEINARVHERTSIQKHNVVEKKK